MEREFQAEGNGANRSRRQESLPSMSRRLGLCDLTGVQRTWKALGVEVGGGGVWGEVLGLEKKDGASLQRPLRAWKSSSQFHAMAGKKSPPVGTIDRLWWLRSPSGNSYDSIS